MLSGQPDRERFTAEELEVHVPISPSEHFLTMVHYLAASLRRLGPPLSKARLVVTVGEDCEPFDVAARNPWSRTYPIRWVWLDRDLYRRHGYFATAVERFRHAFSSPYVLMLDADVLVLGDLSGLITSLRETRTLHGLIAHVSPFLVENRNRPGSARPNADWWRALYDAAGLEPARPSTQHTGWGFMFSDPAYRDCPPYFNLGVLAAPADAMRRIGATIYREIAHVDSVLHTIFKCQLAVCLARSRHRLPWKGLSMRDNFPNRDSFVLALPDEAAQIRILHYLGQEDFGFRKTVDMADVAAVRGFLLRSGLGPANARLREALADIHPIVNHDLAAAPHWTR